MISHTVKTHLDDHLKNAIAKTGTKLDFTEAHSQVNLTLEKLHEICREYIKQVAQKPVLYASLDADGSVMYSEHTLSPLVSRKPRINAIDKPLYYLDIDT